MSSISTILVLCGTFAAVLLDFVRRVGEKQRNHPVLPKRYPLREMTLEHRKSAERVGLDLLSHNYVAKIIGRHLAVREGLVDGDDDGELMPEYVVRSG